MRPGNYEARITQLDFLLDDGTRVEESLLTVPIHLYQPITSVESVESTPFTARFAGDMLQVESGHAETIAVYSVAGVRFHSAVKPEGMIEIALPLAKGTVCIVQGSRSGVVKILK